MSVWQRKSKAVTPVECLQYALSLPTATVITGIDSLKILKQALEVVKTFNTGILEKGMPTWGPVLGQQKITQVTAFIFSFHKPSEPIKQAPPWIPGQVMQLPTTAGN